MQDCEKGKKNEKRKLLTLIFFVCQIHLCASIIWIKDSVTHNEALIKTNFLSTYFQNVNKNVLRCKQSVR